MRQCTVSPTPAPGAVAVIGGALGYQILRQIAPGGDGLSSMDGSAYATKSKIETLLGSAAVNSLIGKNVVDFGCGAGEDAIELAMRGATSVVGVDIQEHLLDVARQRAHEAGLDDVLSFGSTVPRRADAVVSIDAFEHFSDPAHILEIVAGMLDVNGRFLVSFGPTWYHPLGGHLFSVFPWAHLVFSERALIRWRADFKTDGATRFSEVAGGLNQMTISRFEQLVARSPMRFEHLELVPIRKLARMHNRATREFTTAIVRASLVRR